MNDKRIVEVKQLFIELVRVAICIQKELTRTPSEKEWQGIYEIASQQTLEAICFSAIELLPPEQRPPLELLLQWYAITEQTERQNKLVNERCQQTLQFFNEAGFHPTILKGQGIAKLYTVKNKTEGVESLALKRQSGDIDIWLDGGREKVYQFAKQHDSEGKLYGVTYHYTHFHLYDDVEIETHNYPGYLYNPFANHKLHKFFKDHPSESFGDYPNKEFSIIYILLHCFNHLIGHCVGLRQVMDYYFVLRSQDEEITVNSEELKDADEIKNTVKLVKELGMLRFARGIMWVIQYVFRLEQEYVYVEPDEKEGRFILNEIFQTGNIGHHDKRHWGSLHTPLSRYIYNLRRDWHFLSHYPQEVLYQPFFSLWLFFHQKFVWK